MRKICFLFFIFLSLFSSIVFIIDDVISSIKATDLYVYLLLNIQNHNIKNSIYFNNKNNLYNNNFINFNGNIFFYKLPLFNLGNCFLVLDENNTLGIYDSLMIAKNKILKDTYDSITTNIVLSIDHNGLLIQNNLHNNITINASNQVYFNGNSIFINDTINTTGHEINIYNLDKTDMISVPFDIDSNNVEFKGMNLSVSEIDMKNFFIYNNVIHILTNILFVKPVSFHASSDIGNISFLNQGGSIKLSKNLILPNINSINLDNSITSLVLDNNNVKKSSFLLKKNIILSPLNTDILIGNKNQAAVTIKFNDTMLPTSRLTISNIVSSESSLLPKNFLAIDMYCNNINMNNFYNRYNIDTCYVKGPGSINIDLITDFNSALFNGKVIFKCISGIDVTNLSMANDSDTVKQLVMVNQDGLIGYISNPSQKNYITQVEDDILYDDLMPLYILYYNFDDFKNNLENNNIINFIKNIFKKKHNNKLFNKLFQYDIEADLLYYNPIFAEELLESKITSRMIGNNFQYKEEDLMELNNNLDDSLLNIKKTIEMIIKE